MREAGFRIEAHGDHFADDTPDEVWLSEVAARGWVALTHDAKIRYTSAAKAVILEQGARLIVLKGKAPARDLAVSFSLSRDTVQRFLIRHRAPFIAKFYRNSQEPENSGRIALWLAPE